MDKDVSPKAKAFGRRTAQALMRGRRGHGGGVAAHIYLSEDELAAIVAAAFDCGVISARPRHRHGPTLAALERDYAAADEEES